MNPEFDPERMMPLSGRSKQMPVGDEVVTRRIERPPRS
jgi:hypothetical protein